MKTFKDLTFKQKWSNESIQKVKNTGVSEFSDEIETAKQARLSFNNGYEISVITGYGAYGNIEKPYEVAILYEGSLTQAGIIEGDTVQGYMDESEVTDFMRKVQQL